MIEMGEHEAVVSSATKVGMFLNKLGNSELSKHFAMKGEKLTECLDLKTEGINVTRERGAASRACTS